MFNDGNTNQLTDMGSLVAYFAECARRAFTWRWCVGDAEGAALLMERSLARNVPKTTPPEKLQEMRCSIDADARRSGGASSASSSVPPRNRSLP